VAEVFSVAGGTVVLRFLEGYRFAPFFSSIGCLR